MLIINDKIQIKEKNEIYERDYFTRGCKRVCIQIEIPKQDGVTYDTLVNAFSDGASIIRRLTETKIERREITNESSTTETNETVTKSEEENTESDTKDIPEVTYEDVEVEYTKDYPLTDFVVAGDIIDKRDGSFVVYMGVKTETEILEEQNAELILTLVGGEE